MRQRLDFLLLLVLSLFFIDLRAATKLVDTFCN